jgi:hypothetical protein
MIFVEMAITYPSSLLLADEGVLKFKMKMKMNLLTFHANT